MFPLTCVRPVHGLAILSMISGVVGVSPVVAQDLSKALVGLRWREIGPAVMGGRVSDVAVLESNPAVFYVGTATGGVWKTTNHGTTWRSLFDDQPTSSIGDVTVAASNPNVVWVGTGEPQNRQSSPWGAGVFKSTNGGRTWRFMGLAETRHVSRIVVHPANPDVAYVGAVGHLWGPNPERGVFKTVDGGASWEKVLYIDENTGIIDLAMDPGDPQTVFAAAYQRRRTAWGFNGGGPGSGIYRTTDGGASWRELTSGLPKVDKGRIGLDIYRRDGNLVYAIIETQQGRGRGVYRSVDRGETWEHLSETNPRPMYFSQIRIDPNDPERIYLGGVQLFVSKDGGKTFSNDGARGVHSDHHALWIDPNNSNHLLLGSDGGISVSFDRSEHWRMYDNLPIGQFYEIGVDMRDPYYVCGGLQDNGSWCGPSATRSRLGIRNSDWYNIHGGDGFYARIDPNDHTTVFAESQGGNISRVDIVSGERISIRPSPRLPDDASDEEREQGRYRWNWNTPIVMSSHDPTVLYAGANVLLKSTDRGFAWTEISPDLTKHIDRSDLEIMGVLPSDEMLSRHDGVASYGNITTISESPLSAAVLYVGTDDGNVQGTRDGGATWTNLTPNVPDLPARTYVSRVVASRFAEGTVYAAFDGHYSDDYKPYVYVSTDFGRHWKAIVAGLPDWSVNIIAEHPRAENLLFLGNEVGVYVSTDGGERWTRLKNNLPTVPVDDIVVHPRENDLIIGTHGRSVWILDDITPLEVLSDDVLASETYLFPVRPATTFNVYAPQGWTPGSFAARNPPAGALIRYYLKHDVVTDETPVAESTDGGNGGAGMSEGGTRAGNPSLDITILDDGGNVLRVIQGSGIAGTHSVAWDLRLAPPYETDDQSGFGFFGRPRGPKVLPGAYTARVDVAGQVAETAIRVEADRRVAISAADLKARQKVLMALYALAKPIHDAIDGHDRLRDQIADVQQVLRDAEGIPEDLETEASTLTGTLGEIGDKLGSVRRDQTRLFSAIDRATALPTPDQEWRLDRTWNQATELIHQLNDIIEERMPALNTRLNELQVRPDPGQPIELPKRQQ